MKDKVVSAIAKSDEATREARAERLIWLSQHIPRIGGFVAPVEATVLMEEARQCFVGGQFAAALVLSASFIEHKLTDELRSKGITKDSPTFAQAIELARTNQLFNPDLLARTDRIRQVRNPFAHRKADGHEHSLSTRFLAHHVHPKAVLEDDAALAVQAMYAFFSLTLLPAEQID